MKELKPNFTQIPNVILDKYMNILSGAELKVLLYICRRTYGFQKKSDAISITQIMGGITNSKGQVLDTGTGLSNRKVIDCINKLEELKIISTVKSNNKTTRFTINSQSGEVSSLVKKVHSTSEVSSPELVKKVHTQKKGKESSQNKEEIDLLKEKFEKIRINYKTKLKGKTRGFDTEWENYYKKNKCSTVEELKEIYTGMGKMLKEKKTEYPDGEFKYIPHFQTFVNQRKWEEYL